jgi:methyl-accepting chemotaxis protein
MNNWTFGKRLALGFGAVSLIVILLGTTAAFLMNRGSQTAVTLSRDYIQALRLVSDFSQAVDDMRINITPYVLSQSPDRLKLLNDAIDRVNGSGDKLTAHIQKSPTLSNTTALAATAVAKARDYQSNIDLTLKALENFNAAKARTLETGPKWNTATDSLVARQELLAQTEFKNKITPDRAATLLRQLLLSNELRHRSSIIRFINTKAQANRDPKTFDTATEEFKKSRDCISELQTFLKDPAELQTLADISSCLDDYEKNFVIISDAFHSLDQTTRERNTLAQELNTATDKLYESIQTLTVTSTQSTASQLDYGKFLIVTGVIVAFILACVMSTYITRSTSNLLSRIIDQLSAGAMETAAAAVQLSSGSQNLAQGASEQAASIEETSASMEELTSMTKRTAENANNAKDLTQKTRNAAEKATQDIAAMSEGLKTVSTSSEELEHAMNQIQSSSTAITQIMKTIDEIAFQTNILSINAAVEAARAGEAGSGFAVVADEVRTLAQRSADAAKETAKLIEASSASSQRGVQVTQKVADNLASMNKMAAQVNVSLQAIAGEVHKVDEVIVEIASACQEQTQGIGQINTALCQMDKITQSNASNAEQSASAAEEVSAQAEEAKSVVNQLVSLVHGASTTATHTLSQRAPTITVTHPSRGLPRASGSTPSPASRLSPGKTHYETRQTPIERE